MNLAKVFEEFKCCSHGLPEDLVKEAKFLSCGHLVCQVCIERKTNHDIKCSRCDTVNSFYLDSAQLVPMEAKTIELNLEQL